MKHIITIKLVSQPQTIVTTEGPDYWQITLTTATNEGQTHRSKHCSMDKTKALQEAYALIAKQRIYEWFPAFYSEEAEKYADILVRKDLVADRFNESMALVEQGKRTKEQHLALWAARMAALERTGRMLPPPTNQEHVLPQDPPKKWKWYNWFWNPQGDKK